MTKLLVLFGSQTGNAQDVADRVAREAHHLGFVVKVSPFDACELTRLQQEQHIICVASTTGQGEFPDNMRKFWRGLLRKTLPATFLCNVTHAVFGLGDSGYPKYNVVAKKLDRRLLMLGSKPIVNRGLGDDQSPSGYDEALDPWLTQLWTTLLSSTHQGTAATLAGLSQLGASLQLGAPRYSVEFVDGTVGPACGAEPGPADSHLEQAVAAAAGFRQVQAVAAGLAATAHRSGEGEPAGSSNNGKSYGPWRPFFAPVQVNRRITAPSHFQDTRHIEFDLADSGLRYSPGDLLAIFPRVDPALVDAALQRLGWSGDTLVRITPSPDAATQDGGRGEAVQCTARLRAIVQGVLDISGSSPRRSFFQMLRHFATNELEREKLEEFSAAAGRDELYRYNQRERRSVLEVLQDFKSATPPLERLLELCPLLQPRMFSISSSLALHPGQAHITAALVQWQTPWKRQRTGLLSHWLATLLPGELPQEQLRVPVWVESGALRMPHSHATPLIMVGPGTGVAPFRSFLEERAAAVASLGRSSVAASLLFFGCRSASADYYYAEQWRQYVEDGVLAAVITAFSRDQPQKLYVSDRIREQAALVWQLLQQGAVVYVSGAAQKMPAGVASAIEDVVVAAGGLSKDQAAEYVKHLELTGRYFVEAWS